MIIKVIPVGELETNCYLVADEKTREAFIVDPGAEAEKILKTLKELNLKPRYIVNTHRHFDHVGANLQLKEKAQVPILKLKDGDQIRVGNLTFIVLATPGHSPESICLYNEKEKVLFSGDTLFEGGVGRTDLPYSSDKDLQESLKKLRQLPGETKVYPGHGPATNIGQEI